MVSTLQAFVVSPDVLQLIAPPTKAPAAVPIGSPNCVPISAPIPMLVTVPVTWVDTVLISWLPPPLLEPPPPKLTGANRPSRRTSMSCVIQSTSNNSGKGIYTTPADVRRNNCSGGSTDEGAYSDPSPTICSLPRTLRRSYSCSAFRSGAQEQPRPCTVRQPRHGPYARLELVDELIAEKMLNSTQQSRYTSPASS